MKKLFKSIQHMGLLSLIVMMAILLQFCVKSYANEMVDLAESADPEELRKVLYKISHEDIARYNKILTDRGIKFGELIDKSNKEKVKGLIPDHMYKELDKGWNFYVRETAATYPSRRYSAATKLWGKETKLVKSDKYPGYIMEGYKGGMPFPDWQTDNEPNDGPQIMYNYLLRWSWGDGWDCFWNLAWIDCKHGIERNQLWNGVYQRANGRVFSGTLAPESTGPDILARQYVYGISPFDVAGLWALNVKSLVGNYDNYWAYVPSARRVRRAAGSANADTFAGSDMLNDDTNGGYSGQVAWWHTCKVVGEALYFGGIHCPTPPLKVHKDYSFDLPLLSKEAPYYQHVGDTFELRPVIIVETTNGPDYPYSKRIFWIDKETYDCPYEVVYDQKGELWKWSMNTQMHWDPKNPDYSPDLKKFAEGKYELPGMDLTHVIVEGYGALMMTMWVDLQANHASYFGLDLEDIYSNRYPPEKLTVGALYKRSH